MLSLVSTWMGDRLGTLGAVGIQLFSQLWGNKSLGEQTFAKVFRAFQKQLEVALVVVAGQSVAVQNRSCGWALELGMTKG